MNRIRPFFICLLVLRIGFYCSVRALSCPFLESPDSIDDDVVCLLESSDIFSVQNGSYENTINLIDLGVTSKDTDADKNTELFQYALDNYNVVEVPFVVPISGSLYIRKGNITIQGNSWRNGGIRMTLDNIPMFILEYDPDNLVTKGLQGVNFEKLYLTYKNEQVDNTKSTIFYYSNSRNKKHSGWGWYNSYIKDIYCINPYCVIETDSEPIWGNYFNNITCYNVFGYFCDLLRVDGGLALNTFQKIKVLQNIGADSFMKKKRPSTCFRMKGEFNMSSIDVEDWNGPIIRNDSGDGAITSVHLERCKFDQYVLMLNGRVSLKNILINNCSWMANDKCVLQCYNNFEYVCENVYCDSYTISNLKTNGIQNTYFVSLLDNSKVYVTGNPGIPLLNHWSKGYNTDRVVLNGVPQTKKKGTLEDVPQTIKEGDLFFSTSLNKLLYYNGNCFIDMMGNYVPEFNTVLKSVCSNSDKQCVESELFTPYGNESQIIASLGIGTEVRQTSTMMIGTITSNPKCQFSVKAVNINSPKGTYKVNISFFGISCEADGLEIGKTYKYDISATSIKINGEEKLMCGEVYDKTLTELGILGVKQQGSTLIGGNGVIFGNCKIYSKAGIENSLCYDAVVSRRPDGSIIILDILSMKGYSKEDWGNLPIESLE